MNFNTYKVENSILAPAVVGGRTNEPAAAAIVEDIQCRVASAMSITPGLVYVESHQDSSSGLVRLCAGSAAGTRFFAKIFLVDPYPIPARFATPDEELAGAEELQRTVEEQIVAEWNRSREMRCLLGTKNIPALLGRSVEDRILVFEQVNGVRLDRFVNWDWRDIRQVRSMETAMFQAGAWLKTAHNSSVQAYETVDIHGVADALRELIHKRNLETTSYAKLAMQSLESACQSMGAHSALRIPVALNHGDFSLPNLVWNSERQHLWVVDFELSSRRAILHDLCTMIFGFRKPLLYPLTSQSAIQRWEISFWDGYGDISEDLFVFVNAMATARLFYHTLPRLRAWREQRGWWAGMKVFLYNHTFEPILVQRILRMPSQSNGARPSRSLRLKSEFQASTGARPLAPPISRPTGTPQSDQQDKGNKPEMNSLGAGASVEVIAPPSTSTQADQRKYVQRLASGVGVTLVGRTIGRLVRLIVDITLARLLGPTAFGQYAIGWTITRIVTFISPLGLHDGVIRYGSFHRRSDKAALKGVLQESIFISLATGFCLGLIFYLTAPWLVKSLFHNSGVIPVFRWFALTFPLISCLRVATAATQVSQRMKFAVYAEELSQPAVALLLIVVAYLLGWRLNGALAAIVVSWVVSLLLALHYVRRLFPEFVSHEIKPRFLGKELILFSLPASLSSVCGMILIWVDRLYVGHYGSAAEAGTYHAASQLSISLAVILSAFGAMMSPMTADLFNQGKMQRLEEMFRVSTKWALYLSLPPFLIMCFAPAQIMTVAFGTPYIIGSPILPILGLGQLLNAGTGTTGPVLVMTGYQKTISLLTAGTMLVNVMLGFFLVPRWGMMGAAAGTAFTVGGLSIVSILLIRRILGIWPYDSRYLKGLLATGLAAAGMWLLRWIPLGTPFTALVLNIVVSFGIFGGTLWLLGLDKEDWEFINLVLARLK